MDFVFIWIFYIVIIIFFKFGNEGLFIFHDVCGGWRIGSQQVLCGVVALGVKSKRMSLVLYSLSF